MAPIPIILFMLNLRGGESNRALDLQSVREDHLNRIRRVQRYQQLDDLRRQAQYEEMDVEPISNHHEQQHQFIQMPLNAEVRPQLQQRPQPILHPQLQHLLQQQYSYLLNTHLNPQPQQYPLPPPLPSHNRPQPQPKPLRQSQIAVQVDPNIYFERQNIIVFNNQLGEGTFSTVWEGKLKRTGEKVAVKEVRKVEANEISCLKDFNSKYIVGIYDIFQERRRTFIVLEYCERNLKQALKECQYDLQHVFKYFEDIVHGVNLLQTNNILHRDLKLENILVKGQQAKLADFGLAKYMGNQIQVESRRCGSPYTMAPQVYFSETKKAPYTIKSDIWAIGVILHEMLYKTHPFGKVENFRMQNRTNIIKKYGILDKLIDGCLMFDIQARIGWDGFMSLFSRYRDQKQFYPIRITYIQSFANHSCIKQEEPSSNAMKRKKIGFYEQEARPFQIKKFHRERHQQRQESAKRQKELTPGRKVKEEHQRRNREEQHIRQKKHRDQKIAKERQLNLDKKEKIKGRVESRDKGQSREQFRKIEKERSEMKVENQQQFCDKTILLGLVCTAIAIPMAYLMI